MNSSTAPKYSQRYLVFFDEDTNVITDERQVAERVARLRREVASDPWAFSPWTCSVGAATQRRHAAQKRPVRETEAKVAKVRAALERWCEEKPAREKTHPRRRSTRAPLRCR